ncbi:hypothetical protein EV561_15515 [Rhizobium sp. BK376]|jgi:hypothetical protein|nr:hypothetical protein EV561_15515 [Rhizobium sp. BK376]
MKILAGFIDVPPPRDIKNSGEHLACLQIWLSSENLREWA